MALSVLDPSDVVLEKGRYYGWHRTDSSRGAPGYKIPVDNFEHYHFVRCCLPSPDWVFVKAISKTKFEILSDFQEIPDDSLHSGGIQAKFDNETEFAELSDEQRLAELMYFQEHKNPRMRGAGDDTAGDSSLAQRDMLMRRQTAKTNRDATARKVAADAQTRAEGIADQGAQPPLGTALEATLASIPTVDETAPTEAPA